MSNSEEIAPPPPPSPRSNVPEPLTRLAPAEGFFVDEFKNGIPVKKYKIDKNRLVFGRVPDCDVIMEHPSISRYHAALLWSPKNEIEYENGTNLESYWYLVDCGSTHGTSCNKLPVQSGKMIKVTPNNNIIKFGGSTRFYILGAPQEDEDENDEGDGVAEIKDSSKKVNSNNDDEEEDYGCSWGMGGADACDDDEQDNADSNALKSIIEALKAGKSFQSPGIDSDNKTSYSDNPYKTLQQWFVREGYDFDYKVHESFKKFKCTIELPIEGEYFTVDGDLLSKKKEAIHDCCMKACSVLDQAQLLYPWQQRQKNEQARKNRKLEEDAYDDDGDMIDETKSRKKRKIIDENVAETYESLQNKWKNVGEELAKLKIRLATIGLESGVAPEIPDDVKATVDADSLDDFMKQISSNTANKYGLTVNQKIEKSNVRMEIKQLEIEQRRLERLIKIAAPSSLSSAKHVPKKSNNISTNVSTLLISSSSKSAPVQNKIESSDASTTTTTTTTVSTNHQQDDNTVKEKPTVTALIMSENKSESNANLNDQMNHCDVKETDHQNEQQKQQVSVSGENSSLEFQKQSSSSSSSSDNTKLSKSKAKELRKLKQASIIQAIEHEKQAEERKNANIVCQLESEEDFVQWTPPTGQTGDGKTHLNDKFGY